MRRASVLFIAVLLAGCGKQEPVRRYRAPKDPTWTLLGAVLPAKGQTWFFKSVGSTERLRTHKAEVIRFVQSVKFEGEEIRWTAPEGWREEPGTGDRRATLRFGKIEPKMELTVVRLAGAAGGVLANVNRWRDQMGLGAIVESDLAGLMMQAGGLTFTFVDLVGPRMPSGPPMAAGGAAPPTRGEDKLDAVRSLFSFEKPPGWEENPQPQQGRILEFHAGSVTVAFNVLGGSMGGLGPNINRWRGQVGLALLDEAAAAREARSTPFLGVEGSRVDLVGAERSIFCVFTLGDQFSMFLKMEGPRDAVAAQGAAFAAFALSLKVNR